MRRVHIFVEGNKDAYFLHELILQRFPDLFDRSTNLVPESAAGNPPFTMESSEGHTRVDIYWTGGFKAIKNLAKRLRRPAEMEESDEFLSAIIFDSDHPPVGRANKECAGQIARMRWLLDELKISREFEEQAKRWIFLFPCNSEGKNGELEDVLRSAVKISDAHTKFFDECWIPFENGVSGIPANRPTHKSMINEYKAAFNETAWEINGLNRCYSDLTLWDWSASGLEPLAVFLKKLLKDPAEETLNECWL